MKDSIARRELGALITAWEDYRHESPEVNRMVYEMVRAWISDDEAEITRMVAVYKETAIGVRYAGDRVQ